MRTLGHDTAVVTHTTALPCTQLLVNVAVHLLQAQRAFHRLDSPSIVGDVGVFNQAFCPAQSGD
jgi:hypothetical protein